MSKQREFQFLVMDMLSLLIQALDPNKAFYDHDAIWEKMRDLAILIHSGDD